MIQINQNSKLKFLDTSGLVKKTNYDAKKAHIEGKIPEVSSLATKTALTTVENKMPDVTNLATKAALTDIKNKIPDVSKFATKTALTNLSNTVPDISTLIKKATMTQKFQKLKTNMLVILDLTQN